MVRWIGVMTAALLLAFAQPAGAAPDKTCAPVSVGLSTYVVKAHGVKCAFARRWVKRYLRIQAKPRRWKCVAPSGNSNVRVNCRGATKPKNDPRFRSYLAIRT